MKFREAKIKVKSIIEHMNKELQLNESLLKMMFYEQYDINDTLRMFMGFKVFINKALDSIVVLTNPYKDDYELEVFEIRESALEIYRKAERLILEIEKELAKNHNSYKYALFNDIYE